MCKIVKVFVNFDYNNQKDTTLHKHLHIRLNIGISNSCGESRGRTAIRATFNRLLGGVVETVTVETAKAMASASLPGVLVLVFAIRCSGRGGGRRLHCCVDFLLFSLRSGL
jgi:hypothetical protein